MEEGLEVESVTDGQRFNQSGLSHEASMKTQKAVFQRASVLKNMWKLETAVLPERAWKLCASSPYLACVSLLSGYS